MRFRLFGYPVFVSYYFGAMLALLLLFDSSSMMLWGLLAAGMHELGHILMMRLLRCPECEIRLTALGIRIIRKNIVGYGYWRDFFIAIAGPLVNMTAFALFIALGALLPVPGATREAAFTQLAIGAFNLIPIDPLDGGQAVYSLLCRFFTVNQADKLIRVISFLFLAPLACMGFLLLFRSKYNFSLLLMTLYLTALLLLKEK